MTTEELLSREAIRDLVLRYCRAIDRRDLDALPALYHDDAIDDHGGMFCGSVQEYVAWLPGMLAQMEVLSHQVLNHFIEVRGDEAEGEVYMQAYHLTRDERGEPLDILIGGRHLDRYQRRDGVWRFQHRKIVMDWNQVQPSRCDFDSPMMQGTPRGASIDQDPSVGFFQFLGD